MDAFGRNITYDRLLGLCSIESHLAFHQVALSVSSSFKMHSMIVVYLKEEREK